MTLARILVLAALITPALPASAKVTEASERGFIVRHVAEVPADVDATWAALIKPAEWWNSAHTWSGSAANLSLDARAGGCFCEVLPGKANSGPDAKAAPKPAPRGGVEHMRVVYIEKGRALRMVGALGPLQADAVAGTLTVQVKALEAGAKTQILLEYVVGGYIRTPADKMAAAVDGVLGEQLGHLAEKLGGAFAAAFALPATGTPAAAGVLPLPERTPAGEGQPPVGR